MSENNTSLCVESIVELQCFSNKDKLLRCIGWVLQFISNLRSTIKESTLNFDPTLSVFEVNKAERLLVKSIQKESFAKQIHYLSQNYPLFKEVLGEINTFYKALFSENNW